MRYLAALVLLFPFVASADLFIDSVSVAGNVAQVQVTVTEGDGYKRTQFVIDGTSYCLQTGIFQGNGTYTGVATLPITFGAHTMDVTAWENNVNCPNTGKSSLNTVQVSFSYDEPQTPQNNGSNPSPQNQPIANTGGTQPFCSSPSAPGWNISLPDGGCAHITLLPGKGNCPFWFPFSGCIIKI